MPEYLKGKRGVLGVYLSSSDRQGQEIFLGGKNLEE